MATKAQMDRLVGKALFDAEFRARLLEDPEKAARGLRYRLDGMQASRIRSLNPETLDALAKQFESLIYRPVDSFSFW